MKNKLQSNSRLNHEGGYIAEQSFNLPNLNYYRAWDFLRSFDCMKRSIRQNLLNYYRARLNYLITLSESVHPITMNLIRNNIVLLELTFEYAI